MKIRILIRFLLAGAVLSLISAPSLSASGVCRIKIGEEWIPMGASQLSSCLRYAESAASPSERQYASFDNLSFYYIDGQFLRSVDNGRTWQNFRLDNSEGEINSLNVLRGPTETEAQPATPKVSRKPVMAADGTDDMADKVEAIAAEALPSSDNVYLIPENRAPTRRAAATAPLADTPPEAPPKRSKATSVRRAATATRPMAVPMRDCQINTGRGWQNVVTPSLEACGELLAKGMKRYPDQRGYAYWGNRYLLSFGDSMYLSSDGSNWNPMKP